jgi:hypothetical protein
MHPAILKLMGERVTIEEIVCRSSAGMKRWVKSYREFARLGGQSKKLHLEKLGRQTCTFTGSEYRNWVWEFPSFTVLVSKRGVEFDVPRRTKVKAAWDFWRQYQKLLGLGVPSKACPSSRPRSSSGLAARLS